MSRHTAVASRTILVTCCAVFLWQWLDEPWGRYAELALGFTPAYFLAGGAPNPVLSWVPFSVTIVSYMFLHAGWLHLLGNMLCLWVFGEQVEDSLGQPGFIILFLLCGMAAAVAQLIVHPTSTAPVVGASGAVSGLFGACLVLRPRAYLSVRVPIFIFWDAVRVPAYAFLAFWFALQLLYDIKGSAFAPHIGGFVAGVLMAPAFMLVSGDRGRNMSRPGQGLIR